MLAANLVDVLDGFFIREPRACRIASSKGFATKLGEPAFSQSVPADVIALRQRFTTQDVPHKSRICASMGSWWRPLARQPTTGSSMTVARSSTKSCLSMMEVKNYEKFMVI